MFRGFIGVILLAGTVAGGAAPALLTDRQPLDEKRHLQREALVITEILQGYHYSDRPFHELDATELLDRYIDQLDPMRMIFTAGDVEFFHRRFARNLKPVYLFKGDLHPAFEIFARFITRAHARFDGVERRLGGAFDLATENEFRFSRAEAPRPASEAEAEKLWELRLTADVLEARLRGRDETEAVEDVRRQYYEWRARWDEVDLLAVRELFLNAVLQTFDPHSGYFSRDTAREFEDVMNGAISGVGLELKPGNDGAVVSALVPGGPADLGGEIRAGDVISGIGEATGGRRELAGLSARKVAELLSGPIGSIVELTVAREDALEQVVRLKRAQVPLPERRARGAVVRVPGAGKGAVIGTVFLPAFYGSRDGETLTSAARDVRELLAKFAERGVEAVVIDLRDNGGGLLAEAAELAGLFIREGPVAFVRGMDGVPATSRDADPAVAFGGPLVVLVSGGSASASEAFAGALQAYRRAVVVGSEATFGKGTAQDYMDLRAVGGMAPVGPEWGVLRVTRQYFHLLDGRSPQNVGVRADIAFPDLEAPPTRENDLPNALPSEAVAALELEPKATEGLAQVDAALLEQLRRNSAERAEREADFSWLGRAAKRRSDEAQRVAAALNFTRRQEERRDQLEAAMALRNERHAIAARDGYETEWLELDVVSENARAHQAALRERRLPDGGPCANRWWSETFYYERVPGGEVRAVPLGKINFEACVEHASTLAAEWRVLAGSATDEEQMRQLLLALHHRSETQPVADLVRKHLPAGAAEDEAASRSWINALLRRIVELEGDAWRERPVLDVPWREAMRVAADWVWTLSAAPASSPAAASP